MRKFTDWENEVLKAIASTGNGKLILMNEFLKDFYFTAQQSRGLIIQVREHYAVFYLENEIFYDEVRKKKELEKFLELIALIHYLKSQGYITLYRDEKTRQNPMVFVQDGFKNPYPSAKTIILNEKGDYISTLGQIYNRHHQVIYHGIAFDSETYEIILSATTGTLLASNCLKDVIEPAANDSNPEKLPIKEELNKENIPQIPVAKPLASSAPDASTDEWTDPKSQNRQMEENEVKAQAVIAQKTNKHLIWVGALLVMFLIAFGVFIYLRSVAYDSRFALLNADNIALSARLDTISSEIQQMNGSFSNPRSKPDSIISGMGVYYGIDISKWNGNIVKEIEDVDSLTFVICRASMGRTQTDPDFYRNWRLLKEKNLIKGAYHFYYTFEDPIEQADFFWSTIQRLDSTDMPDMPLIVDIEDKSLPKGSQVEIAELQVNLLLFLKHLELKSKSVPILYTGYFFGNQYLAGSSFSKYPLWLAEYRKKIPPQIPIAWKEYKIWQRSDSFKLSSHARVDYDIYYGNRSGLLK